MCARFPLWDSMVFMNPGYSSNLSCSYSHLPQLQNRRRAEMEATIVGRKSSGASTRNARTPGREAETPRSAGINKGKKLGSPMRLPSSRHLKVLDCPSLMQSASQFLTRASFSNCSSRRDSTRRHRWPCQPISTTFARRPPPLFSSSPPPALHVQRGLELDA